MEMGCNLIYLFFGWNKLFTLCTKFCVYTYINIFCPSPQTLLLCASSVGRMELVGGGSLQISNLTEEDGGVYTCTASNANATIDAQTQLAIQGMFSKILLFFFRELHNKITLHQVQRHQECRHPALWQVECEKMGKERSCSLHSP